MQVLNDLPNRRATSRGLDSHGFHLSWKLPMRTDRRDRALLVNVGLSFGGAYPALRSLRETRCGSTRGKGRHREFDRLFQPAGP